MQFLKNIFSAQNKVMPETKSYNPYLTLTTGTGNAHWSGCDYYTMCKRGYALNPIMYACIRMIADGATRVPIILQKMDKILVNHGLLDLLKSPSSSYDGRMFKNTIFSNLLLSGNAYIDCVSSSDSYSKPQALFVLRPDRVTCMTDKSGYVIGYDYRAGSIHKHYPKERILHLKLFSPNDDYYGASPTLSAWRAVELHNEATTFQKALLDNAARPSGCLIYAGLPGSPNLTRVMDKTNKNKQ
jgi:HK97 family phage portal protein